MFLCFFSQSTQAVAECASCRPQRCYPSGNLILSQCQILTSFAPYQLQFGSGLDDCGHTPDFRLCNVFCHWLISCILQYCLRCLREPVVDSFEYYDMSSVEPCLTCNLSHKKSITSRAQAFPCFEILHLSFIHLSIPTQRPYHHFQCLYTSGISCVFTRSIAQAEI